MTFKHSKFEDSVTMRSLEKLAREKGWVKSEPPMTKSASKLDLNPSGSLVENVLKLCSGLRTAGYEKYAAELETKLVTYKQAQTLYETSKEKGDDLVHAAHPKGSHKLEDVEGDEAVFEDIIDKHLKHVEVVEKQPTGKLASSSDVINAVKIVIAQNFSSQLVSLMSQLKNVANQIVKLTESDLTVSWSYKADEISELANTPTIDNLKKIKELISQQRMRLKPGGIVFTGITEDSWARVSPKLDQMDNIISQAIDLRSKTLNEPEATATTPENTPSQKSEYVNKELTSRYSFLQKKLDSYKMMPVVSGHANALKWVNDESAAMAKSIEKLKTMGDDDAKIKEYNDYEKEITDFYTWVKSQQPKA